VPDERLVGRWQLLSYVGRAEDGSVTYPLGQDAQGSLVYTAGGWMTAQVCAADRPNLLTDDIRGGNNDERAAAFSTYVAYSGSFEIRGDVVVHHVAMSSFPNWVGSEQTRYFELTGDELLLRTDPMEVGGNVLVNELRWHREES
jgi:Lipocalin-like domain